MTPTLDRRRLLTVVGVALAVAFVDLFYRYVFVTLSLTVRAALILGVAVACLALTAGPGARQDLPALGMVTAALAFVIYLIVSFPVPAGGAVVLALLTIIGLPLLALALQNGRLATSRTVARSTVIVVLVLATALVGVDVTADDVTYEATLAETVTLGDDAEDATRVGIGTATARNTFVLREQVTFPDATACIDTGEEWTDQVVFYRQDGRIYHGSLGSGQAVTTRMTLLVRPSVANAVDGPIPVERGATCPPADDSGQPRIVVVGVPPGPGNATG